MREIYKIYLMIRDRSRQKRLCQRCCGPHFQEIWPQQQWTPLGKGNLCIAHRYICFSGHGNWNQWRDSSGLSWSNWQQSW